MRPLPLPYHEMHFSPSILNGANGLCGRNQERGHGPIALPNLTQASTAIPKLLSSNHCS
jgi:hypothetical protein